MRPAPHHIYRGFTIEKNPDGTVWASRDGESYHFPSSEVAMGAIDNKWKRDVKRVFNALTKPSVRVTHSTRGTPPTPEGGE